MRFEPRAKWTLLCVLSGCSGGLQGGDVDTNQLALTIEGTFSVEAVHSGKCLDVAQRSTADGGTVQQWQCADVPNQEWEIVHLGGGQHRIVSTNSGKCLDVKGKSTADGAVVHQWRCHDGANQKWEILSAGDGVYQLRSVNSGKCLDIAGAATTNGTAAQQWTCANVPQQTFRLERTDAPGDDPTLPSFCAANPPPTRAGQWQSAKVKMDAQGHLTYPADADKNRIVDFSYAGYRYGAAALPSVPVVGQLGPASGDNTRRIQDALDAIGQRTPDANGLRGALLLAPGRYEIQGTLKVNKSGVVLRGAGDGTDAASSTILVGKGDSPHQRTLVVVGNGGGTPWRAGTAVNVTTSFVQVGALSLDVQSTAGFSVGQEVIVKHPSTQAWIDALGGGGATSGKWAAGSKDITYTRRITKIAGNTLSFDAPIFNHLDRALAQATVAPVTSRTLVAQAGLENLRIDIQTGGGEDENHVWDAVGVVGAEDSWVQGLSVVHFGHAGVFTRNAIRITVRDVSATEPVGIRTGGRFYNFDAEGNSQLVLFTECEAKDGRHNYISNGTQTTSGIVWHRCKGGGASTSEGHRHWSQALLFDAISDTGGTIALSNRGNYGTQHGWGNAHSVVWNYNKTMRVQKPPTAQNYVISSKGSVSTNNPFPGSAGYKEIQSGELVPESLYEAQLCERLRRQ